MTSKEIEKREFPENPLTGRLKLAFNWLSGKAENLLDAGCSYGYGTRFLKTKSKNTFAIDLDELHIEIASSRYKDVKFAVGSVEETTFQDNFFDEIVILDVLEHTSNKINTLNEMYRILKPGGTIVVSTPHSGLFSLLDPYNYGYNFRKYLPFFYKLTYKIVRLIKEKKIPKHFNPLHLEKHEHYSVNDFRKMLAESDFCNGYTIEKIFRSGLFFEVFAMNLEVLLGIFLKRSLVRLLISPVVWLGNVDYWLSYGPLAYNIALKIKKN